MNRNSFVIFFLLVSQTLNAPEYGTKIQYDGCDPIAIDDPPVVMSDSAISRPIYPIRRCAKTLIVVILDESGSMDVQKSNVIGGYNSFVDNQRAIKNDQARLILIKFSSSVNIAHRAIELAEVPHLTSSSYRPGGATALYDAVSEGIR
ncbi:hypothetical protein Fcan01_11395 [Folsomia candida]|uniref:VWFA domain-containing protein n=1 Tax=Folsomia candida TaxID=158441 RepID=A0A226ECI4_FOLCA|nr:hypothetical protein Fcan01_11395 [Folsomia candida]